MPELHFSIEGLLGFVVVGGGFLYQSPFVFEDNKPEKNSHGGERRGTEDSESGEERGEGGEEREIKS